MVGTLSNKLNRYRRGVMSDTEVYWLERRSCRDKIRHESEPHCETGMRAYACPFCGGWHKSRQR